MGSFASDARTVFQCTMAEVPLCNALCQGPTLNRWQLHKLFKLEIYRFRTQSHGGYDWPSRPPNDVGY